MRNRHGLDSRSVERGADVRTALGSTGPPGEPINAGIMLHTSNRWALSTLNLDKRHIARSKIFSSFAVALWITTSGFLVLGSSENPPDERSIESRAAALSITDQATARMKTQGIAQTVGSLTPRDSTCANCHKMDPIFSHPIEVQAPDLTPDRLVLDQGLMTCTTCHIETNYEVHDNAMKTGDPMLRMPAAKLCIACHANGTTSRTGAHASMQRIAHSQQPKVEKDLKSKSLSRGIDSLSQQCLVCHDGMITADAGTGLRLSGAMFSLSHPVGMPYPSDLAARRLSLHSRDARDPRIRLMDGVVGCASCHSVYSSNRKILVIDNDESQLCMGCHNL